MASRQAQKRLTKEYRAINENPPPYIIAKPNDENILEWHYVITGPENTPFEGGQYHGILRFPAEYPFKPPSILVVTPNGRFACNTRLCLSMSDYHPDTWNPAWSVATILTGLLSFMTGDDNTTGSINTSDSVKRKLAKESKLWNNKEDPRFRRIFPDLVEQNKVDIAREEQELQQQETEKQADVAISLDDNLDSLDPEDRARLLVEQDDLDRPPSFIPRKTLYGLAVAGMAAAFFAIRK